MAKLRQVEVVGIRNAAFTSKQTGEVIPGVTIYFTFEDPEITGYGSGEVWISSRQAPRDLNVGSKLNIAAGGFGKQYEVLF